MDKADEDALATALEVVQLEVKRIAVARTKGDGLDESEAKRLLTYVNVLLDVKEQDRKAARFAKDKPAPKLTDEELEAEIQDTLNKLKRPK